MLRFRREIIYPILLIGGWMCLVLIGALTDSSKVQVAFLMLLFVISIPFTSKLRIKFAPIQWIWTIYMIICAVSCFTGPMLYHEDSEVGLSLLLFAAQFVLPIMIALICGMTDIRRQILTLYKWLMTVVAFVGIFEFITQTQPYSFLIHSSSMDYNFQLYSNIKSNEYRMMLIFYHPIYYAVLMSIALLCVFYMPYKNKIVNVSAASIILLNILLTQSRTGWILIAIIIIGYSFTCRIKNCNWFTDKIRFDPKHAKIVFLLIALVVIGVDFFLKSSITKELRQSMLKRYEAAFVDHKFGARLSNLSLIDSIAEEKGRFFYIFGGGSRYAIHYLQDNPTTGNWTRAIDNQYVTTLIDHGIIGLAMFISILLVAIAGFLKNNAEIDRINDAFYLIIIIFMISALFYDPLNGNIVFYFISICFGVLKPPVREKNKSYETVELLTEIDINASKNKKIIIKM